MLLALCFVVSACSSAVAPPPGKQAPFRGVKVGKPYKIEGKWYRPSYAPGYMERGYASWYGPGFHGKKTANGERYNQNAMTAAHKTLPLPSIVKVKNLENGREVTVRVNDRGPFVDGRIIDLSKKAAEELAMRHKGIAKVEVQYLAKETAAYVEKRGGVSLERKYAGNILASPVAKPSYVIGRSDNKSPELVAYNSRVEAQSAPVVSVREKELATPVMSSVSPKLSERNNNIPTVRQEDERFISVPEKDSVTDRAKTSQKPAQLYASATGFGPVIQAASFSDAANANRLADRLASLWRARVSQVIVKGRTWYRVHVGPLKTVHHAQQALDKLASLGLPDAMIVTR